MLIHTYNRTLHILQILEKTEMTALYLCTDIAEKENKQYLLNGLLKKELYQIQIPLALDMKQNINFTDFVDCFSSDGIFYMLFKYHSGKAFSEVIYEPRKSRLEIVRAIIEKMVLQDIPPPVQSEVLKPENIHIFNGRVEFMYRVSENFGEIQININSVELCLLDLIKQILHEEIKMRYSDKLTEFCSNLQSGGIYTSYIDIYEGFSEAYKELQNDEDNLVLKRYRFQVWEFCKRHWKKIKRCLILLSIIAVGWICVYEFIHSLEPQAESEPIKRIGNLVIRENQDKTNSETETLN